jgi:tRNA-Thr(GGU) m(6)t(6)A37 methyltransferase TsaA
MSFACRSIGQIRTPYQTLADCPRNIVIDGPACQLVLAENYTEGLFGLKAGNRILILYWMDKATSSQLQQPSRRTGETKGVFALRTPQRPNPIGAAEVSIEKITDNTITVNGLDCLDNTPLLDIKPAISKLTTG